MSMPVESAPTFERPDRLMESREEKERMIEFLWARLRSVDVRGRAEILLRDTHASMIGRTPISAAYRALHHSFKMYDLAGLLAERFLFLLSLSPRLTPEEGSELLKENLSDYALAIRKSGLDPLLRQVLLDGTTRIWSIERNEKDNWLADTRALFTAEAMSGHALRAILALERDSPRGFISEGEALLLEIYRLR